MTVTSFFGHFFLACGPPLAAGLPFFYHRSLLSLTTVTSMFAWLALLVLVSALFRGFVPLEESVSGYLPFILVTVIVEEVTRLGFWYVKKAASVHLSHLARVASVQFSSLDQISLAYSVGWGHGFTHMLFQFGPFLPLTWDKPTAYNSLCPHLSIFTVSVLTQLGIFGVLAGGHVVFTYGMLYKRPWLSVLPGSMHLLAALLTLHNFTQDGCYTTIAIIQALGLSMAATASMVTWHVASDRP